ncbi:MAG: hypothetical protein JXR96_17210 [Deltaproteobacteria bacterium]|nr:hypothetical protein [Deltaproteobacteria bacterium]
METRKWTWIPIVLLWLAGACSASRPSVHLPEATGTGFLPALAAELGRDFGQEGVEFTLREGGFHASGPICLQRAEAPVLGPDTPRAGQVLSPDGGPDWQRPTPAGGPTGLAMGRMDTGAIQPAPGPAPGPACLRDLEVQVRPDEQGRRPKGVRLTVEVHAYRQGPGGEIVLQSTEQGEGRLLERVKACAERALAKGSDPDT